MKKMHLYHGTNLAFEQFDKSFARSQNDYYGGGIAYLTDSEKVARGYAEARYTQYKGVRLVYEVDFTFKKCFDVDSIYSGSELKKLLGISKDNWESYARHAGLLDSSYLKSSGKDKLDVKGDLIDGTINLTGDQVFNMLSKGRTKQADARDKIIRAGYDSLRYNGGEQVVSRNFGKHNVYIAYDINNLTITKKYW